LLLSLIFLAPAHSLSLVLQDLFNKLGSTSTAMASAIAAPTSADLRPSYTMGSTIAGIEEVHSPD
jgi:hypothetical protein